MTIEKMLTPISKLICIMRLMHWRTANQSCSQQEDEQCKGQAELTWHNFLGAWVDCDFLDKFKQRFTATWTERKGLGSPLGVSISHSDATFLGDSESTTLWGTRRSAISTFLGLKAGLFKHYCHRAAHV
ncbi:MAG: hypothetical protein FRX49_03471 [Trebouxia sp. A1-2]|nr:MAG: hypothetical protein FRX49_03471 [Trebouxia sp. A1-2]